MKPIETVDKCTTCSTCVAIAPSPRRRGPQGPKLTGPSSERFRLYDETGGGEISDECVTVACSSMLLPFMEAVAISLRLMVLPAFSPSSTRTSLPSKLTCSLSQPSSFAPSAQILPRSSSAHFSVALPVT